MAHSVTLKLPDDVYALEKQAAEQAGTTLEEWLVRKIQDAEKLFDKSGVSEGGGDIRRLFGSVDSGDPHSADNERIDDDLAREYGRGL